MLVLITSCTNKPEETPNNYKQTVLVDTSDSLQINNFLVNKSQILEKTPKLNRGDSFAFKIYLVSDELEPSPSLTFKFPNEGVVSQDLGDYEVENINDSLRSKIKTELDKLQINTKFSNKSQVFYNFDKILKQEKPNEFFIFSDLIENNNKISFYKTDPSNNSEKMLKDLYGYYKITDSAIELPNTNVTVFTKIDIKDQENILRTRNFYKFYFKKLKIQGEFK